MAQEKVVENQRLMWFRYFLKVPMAKDWQFRSEIEERTYMFPWHHHQFLIRNHLGKSLGKGWSGAFGLTLFWQTLPHEPQAEDYIALFELRLQQEMMHKQKLSDRISLTQRFWLEERIFQKVDEFGEPIPELAYGTLRFRFAFGADFILWQSENRTQNLKLTIFDEIMINLLSANIGANVFDQNRVGVTLSYKLSSRYTFGITYMNWYQQRTSGYDYFNRQILRFTFFHTIPTRKSRPSIPALNQ